MDHRGSLENSIGYFTDQVPWGGMAKTTLDFQYLTSSMTIILEILAGHIAPQLQTTIPSLSYILVWPLGLEFY